MTNVVASSSALLDRLVKVVAATLRLPVACVGPFDSFTSLGMDSLAAVELTAAIEDELGIELSLTAVHEHTDLDSLCRFLEQGGRAAPDRRCERLLADAMLPRDIMVGAGTPVLTRDARDILLTGATGFLGAHLLRMLLDETSAVVHCLVRPSSVDGLARIRRNVAKYAHWSPEDAARVRVIDGHVARPLLGYDARGLEELGGRVDAIVHAAADVNWVHSYETLRDANVIGTRELLRLACTGRPKPFHFVSSTSVCHSTSGPRTVDEGADVLSGLDGLRLGYAESKCVAEALVRDAGDRGLPVTIVRPSLISGDSTAGRSNTDDLTSRFIAGCLRMHAAPDLDWRLDCVAVDDVARSIVRLARDHEHGIATRHVIATRPRHWREAVLWMRLCGYDIELIPYAEWADVLRETADATHPLYGLRSFFLETVPAEGHLTLPELFEESRRSHVSAASTTEVLRALDVEIAPIDSNMLARYFDDLVTQRAIPDAPKRPKPARADDEPLLSNETLATALAQWLGEESVKVESVAVTPFAAGDSIVAELTALRAGVRAGLFEFRVTLAEPSREISLVVKVKPADEQSIEVAEALAALASPTLGVMVRRFRDDLGLTRSHHRELALYASGDPSLRGHMPRVLLTERDDARNRWLVALERIDDATVINATDTTRWNDITIDAAIAGMANIHSAWFGRVDALAAEPWLAPVRDMQKRTEMTPLWAALAQHAHERSPAWSDHRIRKIHERLVGDVGSWSSALDTAPRTLIHNDFNPRNIAIRPAPTGLTLCAFDWELATLGVPQRDLAELLCFVLPPQASLATIARWVERHRTGLAVATGVEIARREWEAGFAAALCDLLVDRLSSYAMIDRVRPQSFLPRVVRSWLNIFRHYPWAG